ncbi:DNA polymerase III subunits gamma and tau [Spiroplasma gladiatoris]|uniref:DNA polymerase III subunit gamma/tau n=1 Tax=Spiroplasma gladiatoris TaxID=2143 RepID=A0A4P7AHR2_9MOLU|nr:DNA polymerase III subunit gamma/tau [Spiroplasma gladiatoris]QBQ07208.1 DNA polymerase III subunits gamma and tau [Spiroplasma gladiatoris]
MENKKSLYRIYRPKNLDQVAGHEEIKEILSIQVERNNFPHALLFSGQRGTGKTSMAKIFAKMINCENLNNNKSCDDCKSCLEFNRNANPDILEMDAASNNGVDEIRNINNNVNTLPTISKFKVYIIDEVHMLTNSAFNALLKTLEEPPAHVIFILATTEYFKIPATIISRCQIYNFKKISKESVEKKLIEISKAEGKEIDKEALQELFYMSEGSLRDALNLLEQTLIIAKETITINELKKVFYISTKEEKLNIIKNIFSKNSKNIIDYFENANNQGLDFQSTCIGLLNILKEIITFKMTNSLEVLSILEKKDIDQLSDIELKDLFCLSDNITNAYTKSKNSNINYQYILINILKTVAELTTHISVVNLNKKVNSSLPNNTLSKNEVKKENDIVTKPAKVYEETKTISQELQNELIIDQKKEVEAENEKLEKDRKKVFKEEEGESKLLNYQISTLCLETNNLISEVKVTDDQIFNLIVGATKEGRKIFEEKFELLIKESQDNEEDLKNTIYFYNVKVRAANDEAVLIVVEDSLTANWINNKFQDHEFRKLIFQKLGNEFAMICIDKYRWNHIKEEYMYRKKTNTLKQNYEKINAINYYTNLSKVENESIYLQRAKKLLKINIKVVD